MQPDISCMISTGMLVADMLVMDNSSTMILRAASAHWQLTNLLDHVSCIIHAKFDTTMDQRQQVHPAQTSYVCLVLPDVHLEAMFDVCTANGNRQ